MSKQIIWRTRQGDWEVVELRGHINEDLTAELMGLLGETKSKYRFVFREVMNINSSGVRAWLLFLREFQVDRQIELSECSSAIVEQLNMIPNFSRHTKVTSIYTTYHCTSCQFTKNELIEAVDFPRLLTHMASIPCEKCGGTADLTGGGDLLQFLSY